MKWEKTVNYLHGVQGVGGSNPLTQILSSRTYGHSLLECPLYF
ncbi:hypothetical protein pah_c016o088 [Parachlamydia acanthamoebae str. Hall's coccus]|nr:hypothetical protein pah_c016o088 [Parachlamydia acanthamoebae str. Hall's coccus]